VIAELVKERARQTTINEGMAVALIELQDDVREMQSDRARIVDGLPPGMVPRKVAAGRVGYSTERIKQWAGAGSGQVAAPWRQIIRRPRERGGRSEAAGPHT